MNRGYKFNIDRKILYIFLMIVVVMISTLTLAYAALNVTLNIRGNADVIGSSWNIYFANPIVDNGSVTKSLPLVSGQSVSFVTSLNVPGDYYEFTVDVVNDGSINAVIDNIEQIGSLTEEQSKYLFFAITYEDDTYFQPGHILKARSSVRLKARVEFKTDIEVSDLPKNPSSVSISFRVSMLQTDSLNNDGDLGGIEGGENPGDLVDVTRVIALGKSFDATPEMTLYDAINKNYEDTVSTGYVPPRASEYATFDMDYDNVFIGPDGKLLNLMNTVIEKGKIYQSYDYNRTANLSEENWYGGNSSVVFADVSMPFQAGYGKATAAIFTAFDDTYIDVIHACYPEAYMFADAAVVAAFEQYVFEEYVLGYPAGQSAGCGTSVSHEFWAVVDSNSNPIKITNKIVDLSSVKIIYASVDESTMTFEEAAYYIGEEFRKMYM